MLHFDYFLTFVKISSVIVINHCRRLSKVTKGKKYKWQNFDRCSIVRLSINQIKTLQKHFGCKNVSLAVKKVFCNERGSPCKIHETIGKIHKMHFCEFPFFQLVGVRIS